MVDLHGGKSVQAIIQVTKVGTQNGIKKHSKNVANVFEAIAILLYILHAMQPN
jgi:hypothetical protein